MIASPAVRREWRQFQILSRDSVRRLLNAGMLSRDGDPIPFAIWSIALVATPPWMFAGSQMLRYVVLKSAPVDTIERTVLGHRLFFVLYGMLAAALLATLIWDAMFPDRADQEIVGTLPVRPRTVVAARLTAMAAVGVAYSIAISVPSGLMFAFVATTHPALGFLPVVFAAHIIAMTSGCLCVLFGLLILRGLLALVLRDGATQGLAAGFQLVIVVALAEVFFFLPTIQSPLVEGILRDDAWALAMPPIWFTALYAWVVGTDRAPLISAAHRGVAAVGAAILVIVPVYLMPARMLAARALETLPYQRPSVTTAIARVTASIAARTMVVRSVMVFSMVGITRSRRHRFILATYLGMAIATGMVDVLVAGYRRTLSITEPHAYLLALPLVLIFFAVLGLRAAFKVPTDLEANWPFRLRPPAVSAAVAGTRAALVVAGVAPIPVVTFMSALLAGWTAETATAAALFACVSGLLLVECCLTGWLRVPLTCAHQPAAQTLKSRLFMYAIALNLFAFVGANLQFNALQSRRATIMYLAGFAAATAILRSWHRVAQKGRSLEFETTDEGRLETLNLSEAFH